MEKAQKTLRLKYGEYYSLKRTDSSKNIINNVEITPSRITTEQHLFSTPNVEARNDGNNNGFDGLKNGMTEQQQEDNEFTSWTYVRFSDSLDSRNHYRNRANLFSLVEPIVHDKEVPKYDLECEIQVLVRTRIRIPILVPIVVSEPIRIFGLIVGRWNRIVGWRVEFIRTNSWINKYHWTDKYTRPDVTKIDLNRVSFNIGLRQELLRNFLNRNADIDTECHILNWRYKLTGGAIKIERLDKEIVTDYDSYNMRGKRSYTYPDSSLLENTATYLDSSLPESTPINRRRSLANSIGNHILSRYKDGRDTFEMTWQGDPTMTLGDRIILEDKFGIETEFMITGNEFILENNGKFFMRTEGISVL
jgi:hypothetical protein